MLTCVFAKLLLESAAVLFQSYISTPLVYMSRSKKARVDAISSFRDFGVTDAVLAKILSAVKRRPEILDAVVPSRIRFDIAEGLNEQFRQASVLVKLPLLSGGTFDWEVLCPRKALALAVDANKSFRSFFEAALRKRGTAAPVWHVILYHDELTPGNVLRPDNKRKVTAFYFSFAELEEGLFNENAWLCCAVLRHTVIQTVQGGMPFVAKQLVKLFVSGESCFSSVGVLLRLATPIILRAEVSNILGDEAALKQTFGVKGASGLKPCMLCKNCCMKGSELARLDKAGYLQEITCTDIDKFDLASNDNVWECTDHLLLQQLTLRKGQMDNLEKAAGMNANEHGILADVQLRSFLRPVSVFTYDPMHVLFSHGTASLELSCFLNAMAGIGITFEHLRNFCKADWKYNKSEACKNPADVFSQNRENTTSDSFKGMASEVLSVFPLVRQFAENLLLQNQLAAEMVSFRAMHDVVICIQSLKKQGVTAAKCSALASNIQKHMVAFIASYGEDMIRPKHHFGLHLAAQVARDQRVLDTFALERKHRGIKRYATECDNTSIMERSILMRVLDDHLKAHLRTDGLIGETADSKELAATIAAVSATFADKVMYKGATVSVGDVLIAHGEAIIVLAALLADSALQLLVRRCTFIRTEGYGKLWMPCRATALFSLGTGFHQVSYWTFHASGELLTLS